MPSIFIVVKDWMLRGAVRAELREAGLDALGMDSLAAAGEAIARGIVPAVVVLDAASEESPVDRTALADLARRVPFVVVASHVEPGADAAEWISSAAAVLYRPVRVGEIVAQVKQLVEGQAA